MGMYLPNFLDGQTVNENDLDNQFTQLVHTTNFLANLVPCVYYGFNVSGSTGLNITIQNGYGRASDVSIPYVCFGNPIQIECTTATTSTTLTLPASSTVFIVINSNINSLSAGFFNYNTTDTIAYTATLTPSFPSGTLVGQIPIYSVTTNATAITNITPACPFLNFNIQNATQTTDGLMTIATANELAGTGTIRTEASLTASQVQINPVKLAAGSNINGSNIVSIGQFARSGVSLTNVSGGVSALGSGELFPDGYYIVTGRVTITMGNNTAIYNVGGHAYTTTPIIQVTLNTATLPSSGATLTGAFMNSNNQFAITSSVFVTGASLPVSITIMGY